MAKLFKNDGALTKWGKKVAYALVYAPAAGCNRDFTSVRRKLHGIESRGRGRFAHLSTALHDDAIDILDALGVAYELGNDAPRGGQSPKSSGADKPKNFKRKSGWAKPKPTAKSKKR